MVQNQSTAQHSQFHPKKTRQSNKTQGLQMSHNVQLRLRVVGESECDHVLIRVRFSVGFPNHSRPRPSTRWPRPHLGHPLPLAPSDQFRTETAFLLVCDGDLAGLILGKQVQVSPNVACTSCARTASLSPPPRVARGDLRTSLAAVGTALSVMGSWVPIPGCFSFFTSIWHVFHHRKMSLPLKSAE